MRVPINLSSEPFRQDRPLLIVSTACAVLLSGLLCVLIFLIVNERKRAEQNRVAVNRANTELRTVTAEQAKLDAFLRQPANAEVPVTARMTAPHHGTPRMVGIIER